MFTLKQLVFPSKSMLYIPIHPEHWKNTAKFLQLHFLADPFTILQIQKRIVCENYGILSLVKTLNVNLEMKLNQGTQSNVHG